MPVVKIEDTLMRRPPPHIIVIAPCSIVNAIGGRRSGMKDESLQQRDRLIPLPHQDVAKLVGHRQDTERTDRVDEKRVGPVEGINVAFPVGNLSPTGCLRRPGNLEGQPVILPFSIARLKTSFLRQAQEIAVVETLLKPWSWTPMET